MQSARSTFYVEDYVAHGKRHVVHVKAVRSSVMNRYIIRLIFHTVRKLLILIVVLMNSKNAQPTETLVSAESSRYKNIKKMTLGQQS